MRDILEHFDEYRRGRGRLQRREEMDDLLEWMEDENGSPVLVLGARFRRLCCVVRTTPPPSDTGVVPRHRPRPSILVPTSAFAGFRFPAEVITLAVRWYLRFGLSYRDVEELLAERGVGGGLRDNPCVRCLLWRW